MKNQTIEKIVKGVKVGIASAGGVAIFLFGQKNPELLSIVKNVIKPKK